LCGESVDSNLHLEKQESELEVQVLVKENERLRLDAERTAKEMQGLLLLTKQQLQQQQQQSQSGKDSSQFGAVTKEQLRSELLEAALAQEKSEKRIRELDDERARLEGTVLSLMRQNQKLSDELDEARATSGNASAVGGDDFMNTSLADELSESLIDFGSPPPTPEKQTAPKKTAGGMFADMEVVPAVGAATEGPVSAAPQLFADMKVKDDDRQFRDYVFMTGE
jgi:hypothetical protein